MQRQLPIPAVEKRLVFQDVMELLNEWIEPILQAEDLVKKTAELPKLHEQAEKRYNTGLRMLADKCRAVSREATIQLDQIEDVSEKTYDKHDSSKILKDSPLSHKKYARIQFNMMSIIYLDILSKHSHTERVRVYIRWLEVLKLLWADREYLAALMIVKALNCRYYDGSVHLKTDLPLKLSELLNGLIQKEFGRPKFDMALYKKCKEANQYYVPSFDVLKNYINQAKEISEQHGRDDSFLKEVIMEFKKIQESLQRAPYRLLETEQRVFFEASLNEDDIGKLFDLIRLRDFQEELSRLHLSLQKLRTTQIEKNKLVETPEQKAAKAKAMAELELMINAIIELAKMLEDANNEEKKDRLLKDINSLVAKVKEMKVEKVIFTELLLKQVTELRKNLTSPTTSQEELKKSQEGVKGVFHFLDAMEYLPQCQDKRGLFNPVETPLSKVFKATLSVGKRLNNFLAARIDFVIQDPTKACVLNGAKRGSAVVMERSNSFFSLTGSGGSLAPSPSTATLRPKGPNK